MTRRAVVLPSILAADQGRLADEIRRAGAAGADELHVDVMDGAFVPNLSFGPAVVKTAAAVSPLPLNAHLMLAHPERFLDAFAEAGASTIQIHAEASCDVGAALRRIRALGCRAGLALNPETDASAALRHLDAVDEVLCMTVHPGFGGQSFLPGPLATVRRLRAAAPDLRIMVDGGIGRATLPLAAAAGANAFVAGSALFHAADMAAEIALFRRLFAEAPLVPPGQRC